MSGVTFAGYVAILVGSVVLTSLFVPVALRVASRRDLMDRPGAHKQHVDPVPYLGGVAIAVAFSAAVLTAALLRPPDAGLDELMVILGSAVVISGIGLLDDLRGLTPAIRTVTIATAALALCLVGVRINLFDGTVLDVFVTVVWVVGISNAFNLLDNMDGLSAGVAATAAAGFFAAALLQGQFLVAALSIALVGCALTFLRHNFHPARIYMGDAGSLFLGFLLAVMGIKLTVPSDPVVAAAVPIVVLSIAIFDTTLVTVARLSHGRSPFAGGRDHVSHRLVALGLRVPVAVVTVYVAAAVAAGLALLLLVVSTWVAYVLMGLVTVTALVLGVRLALVPVYDALAGPTGPGHGARTTN